MGERLIQLKGKSKKHAEQKLKEARWIIQKLSDTDHSDKWLKKWDRWSNANPNESFQILEQLPEFKKMLFDLDEKTL